MQFLGTVLYLFSTAGVVAVVGGCSRQEAGKTAGVAPVAAEVLPPITPIDTSVVYDSEWDPGAFKKYARDGAATGRVLYKRSLDGDPALIDMQSLNGTPMGGNMPLAGLKGQVTFEYSILEAGAAAKFGMVVIPIREMTDKGPIEVGSDKVADPKNVDSPYRVRFIMPAEHNADGQYHAATVNFDFTKLPGATSAILAPRINEFPNAGTPGRMRLRHVRVTLR